jgi:hypothetical protein
VASGVRIHAFGTLDHIHPDERVLVRFDWYPMLANFWNRDTVYPLNSYVRARNQSMLAYQATTGGVSGPTEPPWPVVEGGTIYDGTVIWTAIAASTYGVSVPSTPVVAVTPAGLTLGTPTLVDGESPSSVVQVLIQGGVTNTRYRVTCQISVGSEIFKGTLIVPVDNEV